MNEMSSAVKSTSRVTMLWGFLTIILGAVAISTPFYTGVAVAIMIGAIMMPIP